MTPYETLLEYAVNEGIKVVDFELGERMKGLYCDGYIFLNKDCDEIEKRCILAEELGHHYTASSNIVRLDTMDKKKQELLGHRWGIEKLLPLSYIIDAIIDGCNGFAELAEQLEVTPKYLQEAIIYYGQKHGSGMEYRGHLIYFNDESMIVSPIVDEVI